MSTSSLVDTHAHLDFAQFKGQETKVLKRAKAAGVDRIINVGTSLERSQRSVELANRFDNVFASVGIHPHDADKVNDHLIDELHRLADSPKVVAVGEIGFDFYYDDGPDEVTQEKAFLHQTAIAGDLDKPLIVHSRDAEATTIRYLQRLRQNWKRQLPGVIHCFTGTKAFAEVCLELDFMISFTGVITYPKNDELREVVKAVPPERILVETDCPFLAPQSQRGKTNEPAFVSEVAAKIAEIKEVDQAEVAKQTTANAERLFGLSPPA